MQTKGKRMTDLKLKFPIAVDGAEKTSLTFRRPKAGDFRRMDKQSGSDLDKTYWLIGALTGLTPAEVDDLDAEDLQAASEVVAGFTKRAKKDS
jgi:hypothetical protein